MKIRLSDRIIAALLALLLLCGGAAIVAQIFFGLPVTEYVSNVFRSPDTVTHKIILIGSFAVVLLLAGYCLSVLFRHKGGNKKFLTQNTEGGVLDISLEALGSLVSRCIEQHPEIMAEKVLLQNEKNSLSVRIIGSIAGGISIPLTVSQLQKQIKQYVTACSGVEVKDVTVTVRTSGEDAKDAPFAIEAPAAVPRLKAASDESGETAEKEIGKSDEPVYEEASDTAPNPAREEKRSGIFGSLDIPDDIPDDDGRPLHQRIFSQPEELCYVPVPDRNDETEAAVTGKESDEIVIASEENKEVLPSDPCHSEYENDEAPADAEKD